MSIEISKMLTLSTAHITKETSEWLDKNWNTENFPCPAYQKSEYGYFIYTLPEDDDNLLDDSDTPKDLVDIIRFCLKEKIGVLCLDRDGDTVDMLPQYEW